jgi:hypothetical protein
MIDIGAVALERKLETLISPASRTKSSRSKRAVAWTFPLRKHCINDMPVSLKPMRT